MALFFRKLQEGYDFDKCYTYEGDRLRLQAQLLRNFDKAVFDEVFHNRHDCVVLDIGCNEGDAAMDRLNGRSVSTYIGLDRSSVAITNANRKYADDCVVHFHQYDVESPKLSIDLHSLLKMYDVEQVDVITISMVLLHLENPCELIKQLRPFLKIGGIIYIKDIDDRDNVAVPDNGGLFKDSYEIAMDNRDSGNRQIGREIPSYLQQGGFSDIRRVRCGLSSVGMTTDERLALFDTYYGFFLEDSRVQVEYEQGSAKSLRNLGWCTFYLPQMRELFKDPNFNFTLGFCTYLATKEG